VGPGGGKRARDNVGDEAQPETIVPLAAADGAAAELKRPGLVAGEYATGTRGTVVAETVESPGPDQPLSFAADIRPLFRDRDRKSMSWAFDLGSYDDVRAHAEAILGRLAAGTMPCDGAWPAERVEVFRRWAQTGMQP